MKAVILGASKGIGRAVAREMALRGDELFLLGIEPEQLERSARDLEVRAGPAARVGTAVCDLETPRAFEAALDAADDALQGFDTVIVTAAMFATQDELEDDPELTRRLVTINYANTVVFCEHVRRRLLERGGGRLVVFSSVAGDRGRKPVVIYGSSKAGLSAYLEGLDHRYRAQGLVVVCVKPGFVRTGMTAGLKPPPFAGEPSQVARDVLAAIDRGKPLVYTPSPWRLVMWAIRSMPRSVMRRVEF